jgi:hypothetical protein
MIPMAGVMLSLCFLVGFFQFLPLNRKKKILKTDHHAQPVLRLHTGVARALWRRHLWGPKPCIYCQRLAHSAAARLLAGMGVGAGACWLLDPGQPACLLAVAAAVMEALPWDFFF